MDPHRYERVREVFEAAVQRPAAERTAFVRRECGDDAEVLREVLSLLASDETPNEILSGVAADALGISATPVAPGNHVGAWKIVRELGVGGMGSVYLAERDDGQFEQRVALKLVRGGLQADALLERFQAERQILAQLDHPHIARLLDGGITDSGTPWFTMEYVDGLPIDVYCRRHGLSVDERIELFRAVCAAVHHAHRNLVVHRDLKPSNVMVDSTGAVKLLDFGIAKVLGEGLAGPDLTRTGHQAMTPAYASPEQVRGQAVTTASDVYSLGVLLYELLSGTRPYDLRDATPSEVEQAICTTVPDRPSRRAQPASLQRRLAGDLDNICLMALRKEPERRYGSAEALADDLDRHRKGHPVAARPDTLGYRTRKFVGRNRWPLAASAAALLVVAALVGFYTGRLAEERDNARLAARKAERVSGFLASLFRVSDPRESGGETVTARQLLDRGAAKLHDGLEDEPEVRASMMGVVGEVYQSLGLFDESRSWLEESLELRQSVPEPDELAVAESRARLATLAWEMADYGAAEAVHRSVLDVRRRLLGPDHPLVAESLEGLGWALFQLDRLPEAERLQREALAIRRPAFGPESLPVASSLLAIGICILQYGDVDASLPFLDEAVDIRIRRLGEDHLDVAEALAERASAWELHFDVDRAVADYRRAAAIQRKALGDNHPGRATTLESLARVLGALGQEEEAIALLKEAVELERLRGEDHPDVGYALKELGKVYRSAGDFQAAEAAFRESLEVYWRAQPEGGAYVASAQINYARLLMMMERYEEAESLLREGAETYRDVIAPESPARFRAETSWGACLRELGRLEEAESVLIPAVEAARSFYGDTVRFHRFAREAALLYTALGRPDRAAEFRREAGEPAPDADVDAD